MRSPHSPFVIVITFLLCSAAASAQPAPSLVLSGKGGVAVTAFRAGDATEMLLPVPAPLFTAECNDTLISSLSATVREEGDSLRFTIPPGIAGSVVRIDGASPAARLRLRLENRTGRMLKVANVVPFGQGDDRTFITAAGPAGLARTKLFRPGHAPIGVIVPDNCWEMGYCAVQLERNRSLCAIARRAATDSGETRRYFTRLTPGGSVTYTIAAEMFSGAWQEGLRLVFQKRYLYDLDHFDNALYERRDLEWIRRAYIMTLQMAWDHRYYDQRADGYGFGRFLEEGQKAFGGYDVFGIWPSWPRLGLDKRNQWDLYRDLPGGIRAMRDVSRQAQQRGTRFFIAFNPWDQSTRPEDHVRGMAEMIAAVDGNGVVLDTWGWSSDEAQRAVDSVKAGVILYSEGMAVPKDMPGIVSGRVHDAIVMPPPLNLNKLIKPDFAIFRVCQLSQGRIHRECAISLFNGYGIELNTFAPGRPEWMDEEYAYLGRTMRVLRENSPAFLHADWTPLVASLRDSIWVNHWPDGEKTLYTVYSLLPGGYAGPLIPVDPAGPGHYVDLWHHEEIAPDTVAGRSYLPARVEAFDASWMGTRREGNVDVIARMPALLDVHVKRDSLMIAASRPGTILAWAGDPSYQQIPRTIAPGVRSVALTDLFGRFEGKVVVQLFDGPTLLDERVVQLTPGAPRRIQSSQGTRTARTAPSGMTLVEAGRGSFKLSSNDTFIPYHHLNDERTFDLPAFYMDLFPVTNAEFKRFLDATHYRPSDTTNFLKHWGGRRVPPGMEKLPVVYVSHADARAYAAWAGKRLPTEEEWQFAASGGDTIKWPWGNAFDSTKCNAASDHPTPVDAFPAGKSRFGIMDLVGNVWQLMDEVYDNGSYYFTIIRGGSHYNPTSSWWYIKGGPQSLDLHQMLLMVSPGFDRSATVGFRCVKDAEQQKGQQ